MRTQAEILARFNEINDDFFGFRKEVLISAMEVETVLDAIPDVDREKLSQHIHDSDIQGSAKDYLAFAIGKILDHRGLSASRSVDKLTEYAWLIGRDDVVSSMESADYTNYGAPKVKAFADGMGWPFTDDYDQEQLDRMARGEMCCDGCENGCG